MQIKLEVPAYPPACISCGLYQGVRTYKQSVLYGEGHLQPGERDRPGVLVVLNQPDDELGWCHPKTMILRKFLNCLEVPWMITGAVRCATDKADTKCINYCTDEFMAQEIRDLPMEIGCIVGAGEPSLRALCPGTKAKLDKARQGIISYEVDGVAIPLIFTNHPALHYAKKDQGGRDLREEYTSVFKIAERICLNTFPEFPPFEPVYCYTWREFDELVANWGFVAGIKASLDIEQAWNVNNPERPNSLHPGAYIISIQFAWRDPENILRTVVLDCSKWDNFTVFRFLVVQCAGKDVIGSNILQYDIPAICSRGGYHHSVVTEFWNSIGNVYDTYVFGTCVDAEQTGYGLKSQVFTRFRVPAWDTKMKLWAQSDEAAKLRRELKRPLDFGDYPREDLLLYAGWDAYWNLLIAEDYPELFDPNHPSRFYYDLQVRGAYAACVLSLTGIPVDPEKGKAIAAINTQHRAELQQWLNTHPFAQLSGKPGEMSTNSPQQSHKLLDGLKKLSEEVNVIAKATTESGMWQLNDDAPAGKKGILSQLADIPGGIGDFFKVFRQVRQYTNDLSKLLMPAKEARLADAAHYPVPHYRVYPEWKVIKYAGDGSDSGRWANKPNVHNTKDDQDILSIYTGYPGGTFKTGWYCDE